MGEEPAYAFSPRASAKRVRSSPISARIRAASWTPSRGSSAGSRRPDAEGTRRPPPWRGGRQHSANRCSPSSCSSTPPGNLDKRRLVGHLPRKMSRIRSASAAMPRLQPARLRAAWSWVRVQTCRPHRGRGGLEEFTCLRPAQAVRPGGDGVDGSRVVLARQGAELVGELLPVPQCVLPSAGEDGDRPTEIGIVGQRPVGVHVGAHDVRQDEGVVRSTATSRPREVSTGCADVLPPHEPFVVPAHPGPRSARELEGSGKSRGHRRLGSHHQHQRLAEVMGVDTRGCWMSPVWREASGPVLQNAYIQHPTRTFGARCGRCQERPVADRSVHLSPIDCSAQIVLPVRV